MRLHSFTSPKKNHALCYCNALCKVCRSVATNLSKFESTFKEIQNTILEFDIDDTKYKKHQKAHISSNNANIIPKSPKQKRQNSSQLIPKCKTIKCMSNPNEQLIRQNMLLNEYFDMFQQKYKLNRVQLDDLKNQNVYLRQMMQQMNIKQKQKECNKMEDYHNNNLKTSFSQKQNDIINKRLLEDISNKKEYNSFKQTISTFIPSFTKYNNKRSESKINYKVYSECDEYTPSNQNNYTSNDENQRYY